MKLGVLSGTFDPVHKGHIWLAEVAIKDLGLDEVVLMPEPTPRRKKPHARYNERVRMLEVASANNPRLTVLAINSDSHSVKGTIRLIDKNYPKLDELWLIMGADVFEHVPKWNDLQVLLDRSKFYIALRTEDDGEIAIKVKKQLKCHMRMVASQFHSLASSDVRDELRSAKSQPDGLDPGVLQYIRKNSPYG